MSEIMFGQDWVEVAEAKSTVVKEDKTTPAFKLYMLPNSAIYFLLPDKKLKGDAINPLVSKLFA